jgi:hypothetical protein
MERDVVAEQGVRPERDVVHADELDGVRDVLHDRFDGVRPLPLVEGDDRLALHQRRDPLLLGV